MEQLASFINTVGFPIVAFLLMYKQYEKLSLVVTDLTVTLKGIDTRIEQLEKRGE